MNDVKNIGVILSGGRGVRAGCALPKQYQTVNGKKIIEYVIDAFKESASVDRIIIAAEKFYFNGLSQYGCVCVESGKERNDTVRNVIDYIKKNESRCINVLFHDSARPQVTAEYIDECFELLSSHDSVITAAHITDSLGKSESIPIDRTDYYLIQTPEAFRFEPLEKCFVRESKWTAIVQQLPIGSDVYLNYNLKRNLKITYPEDFKYFQFISESRTNK